MTTGIPNVNNFTVLYQVFTLLFMLLFALYDYRHHLVKNHALWYFSLWSLIPVITALITDSIPVCIHTVSQALLGFLSGGLLLLAVSVMTNESIGGGDIKLSALLGLIHGPVLMLRILLYASLLVLVIVLIRKLSHRPLKQSIPFVPYLFLGTLLCSLST